MMMAPSKKGNVNSSISNVNNGVTFNNNTTRRNQRGGGRRNFVIFMIFVVSALSSLSLSYRSQKNYWKEGSPSDVAFDTVNEFNNNTTKMILSLKHQEEQPKVEERAKDLASEIAGMIDSTLASSSSSFTLAKEKKVEGTTTSTTTTLLIANASTSPPPRADNTSHPLPAAADSTSTSAAYGGGAAKKQQHDQLLFSSNNTTTVVDDYTQNLEFRPKAGAGVIHQLLLSNIINNVTRTTLPKQKSKYKSAIFCAPGKTGSTSFYSFLFESIKAHSWQYKGRPYIQQLPKNKRWGRNTFNTTPMSDHDLINYVSTSQIFSLAIIRDPKQRIISAYKSKIACPQLGYKTDTNDTPKMIQDLLNLIATATATATATTETTTKTASNGIMIRNNITSLLLINNDDQQPKCLSLEQFLDLLYIIHLDIKIADKLDRHFRPQHLVCFRHTKPQQWSYVTTISNPNLPYIVQSKILGQQQQKQETTSNNITGTTTTTTMMVKMPKSHESDIMKQQQQTDKEQQRPSLIDQLPKHYQNILDEITRDEYNLLSNYL